MGNVKRVIAPALLCLTYGVSDSFADSLPPAGVFDRCYVHLTRMKPARSLALRQRVVSGQISPIDACMEVFASANLDGSGVASANRAETSAVLMTMNDFHRTWFPGDDYASILAPLASGLAQHKIYDPGEAALYFTRALFAPGSAFTEVFTATQPMEALRSLPQTTGNTDFPEDGNASFSPLLIQTGRLLGVRLLNAGEMNKTMRVDREPAALAYRGTLGGGYFGTKSYLSLNFGAKAKNDLTDGGLKLPRRWAKAALESALCRNLPLLRRTDAERWANPASTLAFRKTSACMSCHATMDPLASTARALSFRPYAHNASPPFLPIGPVNNGPTLSPEAALDSGNPPPDSDPQFSARPPTGRLFFRSFDGALRDVSVANLGEYTAAMIQLDDPYVCVAKRYFEYFTGISVDLRDIGDPESSALSAADLQYRNQVIALGRSLKSTNRLPELIRSILASPVYSQTSQRDALGAR